MSADAQIAKEDRPTALNLAGHALVVRTLTGEQYGHDCHLSKNRKIRACADPRHDRDKALLRDALHMLDIIPDPRPSVARDERGKSIPPRARCPYCKRREAVAVNGRLYRHPTNDGAECEGSYQYPVDAPTRSEAVAS